MKARPFSIRFPRASPGFSLIEMLVVLAIIGIVATLSIPTLTGAMRSYQLSATGQTIINQLTLARQKAISSSHAVQVRFYFLPSSNASSSATPTTYRAMQCFTEGDPVYSGGATVLPVSALTKPFFFPAPVIVIANTQQSPLFNLSGQSGLASDPANPLPVYGTNYKYSYFRFRSNGSTDLGTSTNSLTLMLENDSIVANGLPRNYETLQIEPGIGSIRSFRP